MDPVHKEAWLQEFRMNGFFIDNASSPWMVPSFGVRVGYRF